MKNKDWKEEIISNPPNKEEKEDYKQQSETIKELKADIIALIDEGKNSRKEILDQIDMPPCLVSQTIKDLEEENVLQKLN